MPDVALALISGLAGALLVGGFEFYLRRRDERAELRAVARVVLDELTLIERNLRYAIESQAGLATTLERLRPHPDWDALRFPLARVLRTTDEWEAIGAAYATIDLVADGSPGLVGDRRFVDREVCAAHELTLRALAIVERRAGRKAHPERSPAA